MEWINWGSESADQLEQRRRYEEEAREWAISRMLAEARGKASAPATVTGGGSGSAEEVSETTTTTTTTGETTTTTTEATTTTTTEDPNWVQLTFADWSWVETNIGNRSRVSDWNTALIDTSNSNFISVSVDEVGYSVRLYGGLAVSIKDYALAASNLVSIIDNGVTVIAVGAAGFSEAGSLTAVTLSGLQTAGLAAFINCVALTEIDLPNLESTGTACFKGCSGVTSVNLPNLQTVGDGTFLNCELVSYFNLNDVVSLGSGSNSYGGNFDDGVFEGAGSSPDIVFATIPRNITGTYDDDLLTIFNRTAVTINGQPVVWVSVQTGSFDPGKNQYTANGIASSPGSPSVTLGFVINTTGTPTLADTAFTSTVGSPGEPFSADSPTLDPSTTYYVRAYVTYSLGTFYSPTEETFTTPA